VTPAPERRLVIEWPAPRDAGMLGTLTRLYDADSDKQIMTAMRLVAHPGDVIKATATVFADENGDPLLYGGAPVGAPAGERALRTVDIEFIVTAMRIAEPAS
jgi:hypothetical protein